MEQEIEVEINSVDEIELEEIDNIGPRGYSAYEVAVQEGYEGTEEEWLESLKATINGENTLTIVAGTNINLEQEDSTLTINNTYDDTSILSDISDLQTNKANASDLSTVATSGSYNDLSNKPSIPSKTSDITNDSGFINKDVNNLTYYTKTTDINTALNAKQNTIDSSNKLNADLIDDTSATHKFVSSSDITTWNGKYTKSSSGIPKTDLTSDVQTSLGKADTAIQSHQDISGKEDKTNKVTSINSSSTDTQYPSAKCVYDSQQEQNQNVDNLSNRVEYLGKYNNALIKNTNTDTSLTINDTAECPMGMSLVPSALEQATTTGKNLVNLYEHTNTLSSDTTILSTNSYQCVSTGTWQGRIILSFTNLKANTNYTFNFDGSQAPRSILSYVKGIKDGNTTNLITSIYQGYLPQTFNTSDFDEITIDIYARGTGGSDGTLIVKNIQLEESASATTFEPYTGGIASPNPDYPQTIHSISGDNTIKVENQNLFNINNRLIGNINADGDIVIGNTTATFYTLDWEENTQYAIQGYFKTSGSGNVRLNIKYTDGTDDATSLNPNNSTSYVYKSKVTTAGKTVKSIAVHYSSSGNLYIQKDTFEISKRTTVPNYVPHQEQDLPLNLPVENLFDKNNATYSENNLIKNDNGEEVHNSGRAYTTSYTKVKPNTVYTISGTIAYQTSGSRIYYYTSNKTWISRSESYTGDNYTFTTPNNCGYIQFSYVLLNYNADTIQIEEGTKANSYTPYGTTPLEYCKIGNYADEFYKATASDTGLTAGKWYLKKNIGKVVLDGSESGYSVQNNKTNSVYFEISGIVSLSNSAYGLSNRFVKNYNSTLYSGETEGFAFNVSGYLRINVLKNTIGIVSGDTNATMINKLKTYFENNYTNVYYPLATPEYILLNDTLQEELDNMYNRALSYQDQTNISQTNNDLPFVITATTVYDLNKLLTRVETLESEV